MRKIYFELSIYGINALELKDIIATPVAMAYANKSINSIIDPLPTRFLVYVSYYPVEANTFVSVLNSALIALGNQHYKK
jgi:hypothetical protein